MSERRLKPADRPDWWVQVAFGAMVQYRTHDTTLGRHLLAASEVYCQPADWMILWSTSSGLRLK